MTPAIMSAAAMTLLPNFVYSCVLVIAVQDCGNTSAFLAGAERDSALYI